MKKLLLLFCVCFLVLGCSKKEESSIEAGDKEELQFEESKRSVRSEVPLVAVDMDMFDSRQKETEAQEGILLEGSIDLSSTTVNYFKAQEHDTSGFTLKDDNKPLSIIDYGPVGKLPEEIQKPSIYVMFSKPMVPLSKLGEPLKKFDSFKIEPPLEGVFRWYGTDLLSFEVSNPILKDSEGYSKEYKVTINKNINSLTGKNLNKDFSFSFHPMEVKMVNLFIPMEDSNSLGRTSNVPFDLSYRSIVRFNMPVDIDYIKKGLKVKVQGQEVDFKVSRTKDEGNRKERSILLEIPDSVKFTNSNTVEVVLDKGATPRKGTPAKSESQSLKYKTLNKFQYDRYSTYSYSAPTNPKGNRYPLYIYFNQRVEPNQDFGAIISTSLDVDISEYINVYGSTINIANLPVESGDSYSVTISNDLKDIYGQNLSNGGQELTIKVPEANPFILFPDKSHGVYSGRTRVGYLESSFQPGLVIQHQNIDTLSYGTVVEDSIIKSAKAVALNNVDLSGAVKNKSNFEFVDLKNSVNESGKGSVYFNAEATYKGYSNRVDTREDKLLVQFTDIGITVKYGYNRILVWANLLSSGETVRGAEVKLYTRNKVLSKTSKTDDNGLAIFNLEEGDYRKNYSVDVYNRKSFWVSVEKDDDLAELEVFSTLTPWKHGISGRRAEDAEHSFDRVFMFSDRQLYKPGEKLSFRGIHWKQRLGDFIPYNGNYTLKLSSMGYDSKTILTTSGSTSESGGFYDTITLPDDIKPGSYILGYSHEPGVISSSEIIKVAHFRRLNFAVSSRTPDRAFYTGDTINIPVKAYYLAGGGMPGASYSYYWTRRMTGYKPKGERWKPYVFGIRSYSGEKTLDRGEGKLSGSGDAQLKIATTEHEKSGATYRYFLETTVTDIDEQQVSSSASVLVHPSSYYVGAKLGRDSYYWSSFIKAKEKSDLSIALVKPDGEIYKDGAELSLEIYKINWKSSYRQGVYDRVNVSYTKTEDLVDTGKVKIGKDGLGAYTITPETSGSYILRLKGTDKEGKEVETELRFYSYGGGWYYWGGDSDSISLVPDRDLYFVGDTARVMVQSPLKKGKYLLTVEREGIVEESIIELDEDTTMVEIPIKEGYVPRMYVALASYTSREEAPDSYFTPDLGKPKNLFGVTALNVSNQTRVLDVEVVSPMESYRPGTEAEIFIKVTKDGIPVPGAELMYLAVDRGVVDLVNYHVPNPLKFFYNPNHFPLFTSGDDLRNYLMDPVSYDIASLQGGDGVKMEERKDFNPLAAFEPYLVTDKNGIAKVTIKLPDTLTTYRTTAIALNGNNLGYSENEVLVKNPINVRTAFPRRLRYRDTGIGDVVLQNNTNKEQSVTLTLSSDKLEFPGENKKSVTVPPNGIFKVPFLVVPNGFGEFEYTVTVESDALNERLIQKLIVERPITKEAFASSGQVDTEMEDSKKLYTEEGILIPESIAEGFGSYGLSLYASRFGMAKTPISKIKGHCTCTLTERIYHYMPDAVLGEKLEMLGFRYKESSVKSILTSLKASQTSDGWIRYWSKQRYPSIYIDLVSLMFISHAKENGVDIPNGLEYKLAKSLTKEINNVTSDGTKAFGAYILNKAGEDVSSLVSPLLEKEEVIGLTGLGYLTSTLMDMGRNKDAKKVWKEAKRFVRPGTRTIDINEPYETRWYFDSEVRQLSALVLAGVKVGENKDLLQRYYKTLEDRLNTGAWRSYSDYTWSLVAINELAKEDKVDALDMTTNVYLDNKEVGNKTITEFADSTLDIHLPIFSEPLSSMDRGKLYPLRIEKEGKGNIYYAAQIEYGLPSEVALPRDEGIGLFLEYETLEGEKVKPDEVEVGTTYRVRVVISSNRRRSYLTLDVPVPSGIEIVDPSFATTSAYQPEGGVQDVKWSRETVYGDETEFTDEGYGYYSRFGDLWWFWKNEPDQEIYDNHISYSWDSFYEGKKELTFLVRATSKGIYPTPPAQANLLFEPEVFGRTGGSLFVIK